MDKNYKIALHETLLLIDQTKEQLVDKVFELAINGKLKHWADTVEEGEDFYFSKELFLNLGDKKIISIINLIDSIENLVLEL